MRHTLPDQLDLVPAFHPHVRSRELEAMSQILDAHPEAAKWVLGDLVGRQVSSRKGRKRMSGDQVLRVMVVKQLGSFSYDELAFHLADSASYRAFCRIGSMEKLPTSKTLQRNVKKVDAITLERINVLLVEHAIAADIEDGNKIRVDCTVVETNIHDPSDSSLLVDSVRVLVRLMDRAQEYVDAPFTNHHRRAKRRAVGILHARTQDDRLPLYRDLWLDSLRVEVAAIFPCILVGVGRDRQPVAARAPRAELIKRLGARATRPRAGRQSRRAREASFGARLGMPRVPETRHAREFTARRANPQRETPI